MCGRFTLATAPEIVAEFFELTAVPDLPPRYNVAPSQEVPAVIAADGVRQMQLFRWGLIPGGTDDPAIGNRMINARGETVADKPAFRTLFRERRCLIVADGFYEWQKAGRHKQPYYIRMRDAKPFAFAGLWDWWGRGEQSIRSCTVITGPPNELVAPIHDRMPVILGAKDFSLWLDPAVKDPQRLTPLLVPYAADRMTAYAVTTRVNGPSIDDRGCIEPQAELF